MPAPAPIPVEAAAAGIGDRLDEPGLESIVELNVSVSSTEQATILAVPLLAPTLFLGYRLRRVTLGGGLDLIRVDNFARLLDAASMTTTTTPIASLTDIEIRPGVRVSLVESRDRKTELIGDFDIGYIAQSSGGTANSAGMSTPTNSEYIVQGGIGLRRWLAPSFAIGVTTVHPLRPDQHPVQRHGPRRVELDVGVDDDAVRVAAADRRAVAPHVTDVTQRSRRAALR